MCHTKSPVSDVQPLCALVQQVGFDELHDVTYILQRFTHQRHTLSWLLQPAIHTTYTLHTHSKMNLKKTNCNE